jgi:hypothetical protein
LLLLGLIALAVMAVVAHYDFAWTLWLSEQRWSALTEFMDPTIFEGESFGGGDVAIVFLLVAVVGYFLAWHRPLHKALVAWRPYFGLVIAMGVVYEICFVHSLKYLIGRSRPGQVLSGMFAYSDWFEFGSLFITQGTYRGSCPSGHTAIAFILVIPAFLVVADRAYSVAIRTGGLLWGAVALAYCGLMAASRSMTLSHWVGDCVFSVVGGFLLLHVLYFYIFRVPLQMEHYRRHGAHPRAPMHWDCRLSLLLVPIALGALCIGFAIRSVGEQAVPWLAFLALPGIAAVLVFGRLAIRYRRRALASYCEEIEGVPSTSDLKQAA